MDNIFLFLIAGSILIFFIKITAFSWQRSSPNPMKKITYESGEYAQKNLSYQFPITYYLIAILFLVFEIEIILLLPWSIYTGVIIKKHKKVLNYLPIISGGILFLATLALGLWYIFYKKCFKIYQPKIPKMNTPIPKESYPNYKPEYAK